MPSFTQDAFLKDPATFVKNSFYPYTQPVEPPISLPPIEGERATKALSPTVVDAVLKSKKDLQKEISGLQGQIDFTQKALTDVNRLGGGDLQRLARDLAGQGLISNKDISDLLAAHSIAPAGSSDLLLKEVLKDRITRELPRLQSEISKKSQNILDLDIADIRQGEQRALGELSTQKTALDAAIDERLAALLDETGFQANLARQQTAEGFAARGLGRSSFAQRGLEDVTAREFGQKAQFQSEAATGKTQVSRAQEKIIQKIADTRKQLEFDRNLNTMQAADDVVFAFDKQEIENMLAKQLADIQLQGDQSGLLGGILGNLFSGAAQIVTGQSKKEP